jgi:hypothetical protein
VAQIVIAKYECRLLFTQAGEIIKDYSCATGRDMCSPTGPFVIGYKRFNGGWRYSDGDWHYTGGGEMSSAFGPFWMPLSRPGGDGTNYGVHGTNDPSSIGNRVSHGCIRLQNRHADEVHAMLPLGTRVRIVDYISEAVPSLADQVCYLVAYASSVRGGYDLYTVRSDAQGKRRLTDLPGDEREPAFSPDAGSVAFLARADSEPTLGIVDLATSSVREIAVPGLRSCLGWTQAGVVVRLSDERVLAVDPAIGAPAEGPAEAPRLPSVSDDGRTVVVGPEAAPKVTTDSIKFRLSRPPRIVSGSLLPEGAGVVFAAEIGSASNLFACRPGGSFMRRLTEGTQRDVEPAVSPVRLLPYAPAKLRVFSEPTGQPILVRPVGSSISYPRGRTPCDVGLSSARADGSEFEVCIGRPGTPSGSWSRVSIRSGETKDVHLSGEQVGASAAPEPGAAAASTGTAAEPALPAPASMSADGWPADRYTLDGTKCGATFAVQLRATLRGGSSEARVLVNMRDAGSSYRIGLAGEGVSIWRVTDGVAKSIGDPGVRAIPIRGAHTVTIVRTLPDLRVFVDGQLAARASDSTYLDGTCAWATEDARADLRDVLVQPREPLLFADDFTRTAAEPSAWTPERGKWVNQSADGPRAGNSGLSLVCKAGSPMSVATTGSWFWSDYRTQVSCYPLGAGEVGVWSHRSAPDRGYVLSLRTPSGAAGRPGTLRLVRMDGKGRCLLGEARVPARPRQWYRLGLTVAGGRLEASLDGARLLTVSDQPLPPGPIALQCASSAGAVFDDVLVEGVGGEPSRAPAVAAVPVDPAGST